MTGWTLFCYTTQEPRFLQIFCKHVKNIYLKCIKQIYLHQCSQLLLWYSNVSSGAFSFTNLYNPYSTWLKFSCGKSIWLDMINKDMPLSIQIPASVSVCQQSKLNRSKEMSVALWNRSVSRHISCERNWKIHTALKAMKNQLVLQLVHWSQIREAQEQWDAS